MIHCQLLLENFVLFGTIPWLKIHLQLSLLGKSLLFLPTSIAQDFVVMKCQGDTSTELHIEILVPESALRQYNLAYQGLSSDFPQGHF